MTHAIRLFFAAALCALVGTACSSSKTTPPTDLGTGITFDAGPDLGPQDLGSDFGGFPPPGDVGAACEAPTDCTATDAMCIPATDFPGGYCTIDCTAADCPVGSVCMQVGPSTSYCLDECDPASATRQCRTGYGCAETAMGSVCVPGCSDDTDCTGGTLCNVDGNGGQCYTPGSNVGDPCTGDALCPAGAFCLSEDYYGWPAGMCVTMGCDAVAGTGCPTGSTCTARGSRMTICVAACTVNADCRTGYECLHPTGTTGAGNCSPILPPGDIGQPCSAAGGVSCAGGSCLREASSGYPGSYCTLNGCTPGTTGSGCPGDTLCVADGTTNRCLDACTANSDCRDAYTCTPIDPADVTLGQYCKPSCTLDTQCVNAGATCTVATGRCTPPPP
jgi:hypothetical protein